MKVSVIGTGYVGLVSGVCLAEMGHDVVCVDSDAKKVALIKQGIPPIFERGLESLLRKHIGKGLRATTNLRQAVIDTQLSLIAVGTPFSGSEIDLRFIKEVSHQIGEALREKDSYHVVVVKSTVVPGTTDITVLPILEQSSGKKAGVHFGVGMNPEFLTEGEAVNDFMNPDRIVLGGIDAKTIAQLDELYSDFDGVEKIRTNSKTAEMIKYASNAFLATKISFMNELADLCECVGADIKEVAAGMGYDARIGRHFLDAGLGWGGSCFPKDVKALAYMAKENGLTPRILDAVTDVNYSRRSDAVRRLEHMLGGLKGKTVGLFGLAFKPNTDDMREAPSIDIVQHLADAGARIRGYDPVAMDVARPILPTVEMFKDPYEMATGCDGIMIITEWNEFKQLDLDQLKAALKAPVLFDGRNIYDPVLMKEKGFAYQSIGRSPRA